MSAKYLWLSRKADGRYMLTHYKPQRAARPLAGDELYPTYGDPLVIQWLCETGVKWLYGVELQKLDSIEVTLEGKTLA